MTDPAPTRLAATILLVRDGSDGAEICMIVRNRKIAFASGALVFPGGSVDAGDSDAGGLTSGDVSGEALTLRVAAIREAFEECGVLLARRGGALITGDEAAALVAKWRARLEADEVSIADIARAEGLTLAVDLIQPFAHWITPEAEKKRFDTHFFIAKAPADHALDHDGGEAVEAVWLSPNAAMEEARAGTKALMFPTWLNLQVLETATTADAAIELARAHPVVTVMPEFKKVEGGVELRIPAEAKYAHAEYFVAGFAAEPQPIEG